MEWIEFGLVIYYIEVLDYDCSGWVGGRFVLWVYGLVL